MKRSVLQFLIDFLFVVSIFSVLYFLHNNINKSFTENSAFLQLLFLFVEASILNFIAYYIHKWVRIKLEGAKDESNLAWNSTIRSFFSAIGFILFLVFH